MAGSVIERGKNKHLIRFLPGSRKRQAERLLGDDRQQ